MDNIPHGQTVLSSGHHFLVQWAWYAAQMTNQPPSRMLERIMVRLPDGMRDKLANTAKANGRSVNAEVVARLEASFSATGGMEDTASEIAKIQGKLKRLEGNFVNLLKALHEEDDDVFKSVLKGEIERIALFQEPSDNPESSAG